MDFMIHNYTIIIYNKYKCRKEQKVPLTDSKIIIIKKNIIINIKQHCSSNIYKIIKINVLSPNNVQS